jgi:hypothetical protein
MKADEMAGHAEHMEDTRGVYKMLSRNPEGMRPLGRTKCRWYRI